MVKGHRLVFIILAAIGAALEMHNKMLIDKRIEALEAKAAIKTNREMFFKEVLAMPKTPND